MGRQLNCTWPAAHGAAVRRAALYTASIDSWCKYTDQPLLYTIYGLCNQCCLLSHLYFSSSTPVISSKDIDVVQIAMYM